MDSREYMLNVSQDGLWRRKSVLRLASLHKGFEITITNNLEGALAL
jgi:hypothetical protein